MEKTKLDTFRRNLFTAKPLFKVLEQYYPVRQTKTSKAPRNLPNLLKGNSMDCSKENLSYETYLTKVKSANKIDQKTIVSEYLNNLRKQYDRISKNTKIKQSQINLLTKQINFIRTKLIKQLECKTNVTSKIWKNQQLIQKIKQKHQIVKMQTKILYQMIDRMKKDQIHYKNMQRIIQGQTFQKEKCLKQKKQELYHHEENIQKLLITVQEFKDSFQKNKLSRENKYIDYFQKIQSLQDKQKFIRDREERTYELLGLESNDTLNSKNIIARQIYMTNKIAQQLLEDKINTLLKKYEHIQNAFHTIKSKTSIADPSLLTTKFFSYGQLSENLIKSIYASEIDLEKISQKNKQLINHYKELLSKNYEGEYVASNQNQKTLQQRQEYIQQELTQKILVSENIKNWINKKLQSLKCEQVLKNDSFFIKFNTLCTKLKEQVRLFESKQKIFDRKYQTSGIRVKKIIKELSIEEQNIRKSESQEMDQSIKIQNQFLSESRFQTKQNFMQNKSKFTEDKECK